MIRETWFVMEDGSCGDPREVRPEKDGKLVHKDGRKVAYAAHGPRSRSVDPEAEKPKKAVKEVPVEVAADQPEVKEIAPEKPKPTYKTRESKAK